MKRSRQYVEYCDLCDIQFESSSSFLWHCASKNHKRKSLVSRSLAQSVSQYTRDSDEEELDMLQDETMSADRDYPEQLVTYSPVSATVYPEYQPVPPVPQLIDSENDGREHCTEKGAFFPFPDEKFFLSYCYAHGIMRPKVRNRFKYLNQ